MYEFPKSTRRSCARTSVDINAAPRAGSEPLANNLVLISKRRRCSYIYIYNQGFVQPWVLQPGVLTTRGLSTTGSYNQGSYNQGFLQPGILEPRGLKTRGSYNQGSYNQGSLQP